MNSKDRDTFIIGQLNTGLRTEWSQIDNLEGELENLLHEAKARAHAHIPATHLSEWDRAWSELQFHLESICSHAADTRSRYSKGETGEAIESWTKLIEHERALDNLLETVRIAGREAVLPIGDSDPWYDSWKLHWMTIDDRLSTLRAHAVTTRFKLGMRKNYGDGMADILTKEILEHLPPDATLEDAEKFADEYRRAHLKTEEHHEHPTIRDIIRSLFLMPDENADDHLRHQRMDEAKK